MLLHLERLGEFRVRLIPPKNRMTGFQNLKPARSMSIHAGGCGALLSALLLAGLAGSTPTASPVTAAPITSSPTISPVTAAPTIPQGRQTILISNEESTGKVRPFGIALDNAKNAYITGSTDAALK